MDKTELEEMAKSFSFGESQASPFFVSFVSHLTLRLDIEKCKQRTRLNEYLTEDSKRSPGQK